MAIRCTQGSSYEGNDWWRWWVELDGPSEELDQVKYVVYTLHPTFPKPVRHIKNRKTNFRLETGGWGTFTIYVEVLFRDGTKQHLEHELELSYPDELSGPTRSGPAR